MARAGVFICYCGANIGGTIKPWGEAGVKITQVHAEHSSELTWKNAETGKEQVHVGGAAAGFILEIENGLKITRSTRCAR